jgi:hypothetical protein
VEKAEAAFGTGIAGAPSVFVMSPETPSVPAVPCRDAHLGVRRLRRQASRTETVVRAAVLAAALATLGVGLGGALRHASAEVVARLDAATRTVPMR